jgi:hypothetical protein
LKQGEQIFELVNEKEACELDIKVSLLSYPCVFAPFNPIAPNELAQFERQGIKQLLCQSSGEEHKKANSSASSSVCSISRFSF